MFSCVTSSVSAVYIQSVAGVKHELMSTSVSHFLLKLTRQHDLDMDPMSEADVLTSLICSTSWEDV